MVIYGCLKYMQICVFHMVNMKYSTCKLLHFLYVLYMYVYIQYIYICMYLHIYVHICVCCICICYDAMKCLCINCLLFSQLYLAGAHKHKQLNN